MLKYILRKSKSKFIIFYISIKNIRSNYNKLFYQVLYDDP
jgi:hypothetical protein